MSPLVAGSGAAAAVAQSPLPMAVALPPLPQVVAQPPLPQAVAWPALPQAISLPFGLAPATPLMYLGPLPRADTNTMPRADTITSLALRRAYQALEGVPQPAVRLDLNVTFFPAPSR